MWKPAFWMAVSTALFVGIVPITRADYRRVTRPAGSYENIPSPAATESTAPDDSRVLEGHYFIRNGVTTFPLAVPYVNMSLSGAMTTLSVEGADQPVKSVGISPSVIGQFKVGSVAVELGGQFAEIFGSNSYSAFIEGANVTYGFSSALKLEAVREENWALTPEIFYSLNSGIGFSPLTAISQNISTPDQASASSLLTKTLDREIRPELLFAFAPAPEVGLSGELGMGFDNSIDPTGTTNTDIARIGLAADLNFGTKGVPLGMSAFFLDESALNQSQSNTEILGGGLYEMVNKNFNFGVEVSELISSISSMSFLLSLTAYY